MLCYIKSHARHVELQKYFNISPLTTDILISEFQRQTESDKYPSVMQVLDSYKEEEVKYMSRDQMLKERLKYQNNPIILFTTYDTGVNGNMAIKATYKSKVTLPDVRNYKQDLKEAEKKVAQDRQEGTTEEGEVAYQKEGKGIPDEQLDSRITNFLNKLGVKVNSLDGIKNDEGELILDTVARAKFTKKQMSIIIDIVEKKRGLDSLSEEAAHVMVWMLRGTALYNSMMNDITKMAIYQEVKDSYGDRYTSEVEFKEEAIAKQITASIVRQNLVGTDLSKRKFNELTEQYDRMNRWLNRAFEWLRELFNNYKINAFDYTAMKILFADTSGLDINRIDEDTEMYQIVAEEKTLNEQVQFYADKLKNSNVVQTKGKDSKGNEINVYHEDVFKFKQSVTNWVKGNKVIDRTELEKEADKIKRIYGVDGHDYITNAVVRAVEIRKFVKSRIVSTVDSVLSQEDKSRLDTFAENFINSYPDNAIFIIEKPVGDKVKNRAGTPDLVIFFHDDAEVKMDIIDWKFSEFRTENGKIVQEELIKAKKEDYQKQVKEYRRIIEDNYIGKKLNGKTHLMPIATKIQTLFNEKKAPVSWKVVGIEPTNLEFSETKKHLNPIPLETEKTGNAFIDRTIEGLIKERDVVERSKGSNAKDRVVRQNRLAALNDAIKTLILTKDINSFLDVAINELNIINAETDLAQIDRAEDSLAFYSMINFGEYRKSIDEEEYIKIKEKVSTFRDLVEDVSILVKAKVLEGVREVAENTGIEHFDTPQKDIGVWARFMSSFSTQQHPKIKALYKLVLSSKNKTKLALDEANAKIKTITIGVTDYAKRNGIDLSKAFEFMITRDKLGNIRLISKYDKDALDKINNAKATKNHSYLKSIYTFDNEKYDNAYKANKEYWEIVFKNNEHRDKKVQEKVEQFEKAYNVEKYVFAYTNTKNYYLSLNDTVETSKEYNKIQNTPELKAFYDFFTSFVKESREDLGIEYEGRFIPQVVDSVINQISSTGLGAIEGLTNGFLNSISASYQGNYGEVNTITGKTEYTIPLPYTNRIGTNASTDLGKVLGLWAMAYYNNKHMKEVETSAHLLYHSLREENLLVTKLNGDVKLKETGEPIIVKALESNTLAAFIDFMNEGIYGVNIKGDKAFVVKRKRAVLNDDGEFVKDENGNIVKEEYDYEVSAFKIFNKVLSYVSTKALSFNLISSSANIFGGMSNALIEGAKGQFYNKKQFVKGAAVFASGQLNPEILTAIKYFDIMGDMDGFNNANALSVSAAERFFTYDKMFILQRKGDTLVHSSVLLAMMQSHGVGADGKVENLNKLPEGTKSLYDSLSIKDGNLNIPGLTDVESKAEYLRFRNKVLEIGKKVMGISPTYDIKTVNQTIWGRMLMQFRNWMPRMAEERFGGIRYNENLETFEQGRYATFYKFLQGNIAGNALEVLKLATGIGSNLNEILGNKFELLSTTDRNFLIQAAGNEVKAKEEYIALQKANMKAILMELQVMLVLLGTIFMIKGGDDDDEDKKGLQRILSKTVDRFSNELTFFVNPNSFNALMKNAVPVSSLLTDVYNFTYHTFGELTGDLIGSKEMQDKFKPLKYTGHLFPISTQVVRNISVYSGENYWK